MPFRTSAGCADGATTETIGRMTVATWTCATGDGVVRGIVQDGAHTWPGYSPRKSFPRTSAETSDFLWTRMTGFAPHP